MNDFSVSISPVAFIENDYTGSFGIPRQSGLVKSVKSKIVFTKEYRDKNALRGLEQYSDLWLIWGFSENANKEWSPTVRPPKLGGNKRVGVFATRSPFRPNGLGLSRVSLINICENEKDGMYLVVGGADLKNNTPIYDIKPYIPYTDCVLTASGGFATEHKDDFFEVVIPENIKKEFSADFIIKLTEVLSLNPVPQYKNSEKTYGMRFADCEVRFLSVDGKIKVTDIIKADCL